LVGFEHAALWEGDNPIAFAIRKIELDYKKPARIDDSLTVRTTYDRIKGPRLFVSQAVWRGDEELVTAVSEATAISPEGRPRRMPKNMMETLAPYLER